MIRNPDLPSRRDTAAFLPPFQASGLASTQSFGSGVHIAPCDRLFGHDAIIGQIVQTCKDNLPSAIKTLWWHKSSMFRDLITPTEFDEMFIARTKALRELKGVSAAEMAAALKIPAERYRKYESRTPLPHDLMEPFALITGVSVEFLITGRRVAGKGPYPDVPGPHMLNEWRAQQAEKEARKAAKSSKREK